MSMQNVCSVSISLMKYTEMKMEIFISTTAFTLVRLHTIEDALAYDIKCPECGHRNTLRQIGRVLDMHNLGLYKCPCCDKQRTKRSK
nr:MAG TPA: terminase large subunit [Bacteriophage sp.]